MFLIASGLHSQALAVLSCVRDSEVFGEFQDLYTRYGFGLCDGLELLLGHGPGYGPVETYTYWASCCQSWPGLCAQGCLVQASDCLWRRTLLIGTDSDIGFLTRW